MSYFYLSNNFQQHSNTDNEKSYQHSKFNSTETKYVFADQNITFEYPLTWKVSDTRQFTDPYQLNLDFLSECNSRHVASFAYKLTDPHDSMSYILGQKNPQGPAGQTSEVEYMNGIEMGINVQPEVDGSGGYEPKIVVDFLSKNKDYHFYFTNVSSCNLEIQEVYHEFMLPLLQSIELFN